MVEKSPGKGAYLESALEVVRGDVIGHVHFKEGIKVRCAINSFIEYLRFKIHSGEDLILPKFVDIIDPNLPSDQCIRYKIGDRPGQNELLLVQKTEQSRKQPKILKKLGDESYLDHGLDIINELEKKLSTGIPSAEKTPHPFPKTNN